MVKTPVMQYATTDVNRPWEMCVARLSVQVSTNPFLRIEASPPRICSVMLTELPWLKAVSVVSGSVSTKGLRIAINSPARYSSGMCAPLAQPSAL